MAVTPKASFRLSAEAVAAIADVQALLAAKRGGKPVSQAGAIDYAIRRAAEDLRAEPQRQLSEVEWQMVEEHLPKTGWPAGAVVEAWKDDTGRVQLKLQHSKQSSSLVTLMRVPVPTSTPVIAPRKSSRQGRPVGDRLSGQN